MPPLTPIETEWLEILSKVKVTNFPVRLSIQDDILTVCATVRDVNLPSMVTEVLIKRRLSAGGPEKQKVRFVHTLILDLLRHELDEGFTFEGRRVFNPHDAYESWAT